MARIMVTGGTGLIGSEAVRQLVAEGHDVVIFEFSPNRANIADIQDDVEVVRGDVTDLSQLLHVMRSRRIERVLHLAAFIFHEAELNPMRSVHVNAIGTGNIYDAALSLGVERVCAASTVAVLGTAQMYGDKLVTEDDPASPSHAYGASKLVTEIMAQIYKDSFGLDAVIIRPALAYGVGRLTGGTGAFNDFVRRAALGQKAVLRNFGAPGNKIQPIYVKDMARAFVAGTLRPTLPRVVYNAPVTDWCHVRDMVDLVRELAPGAVVEVEDSYIAGWVSPMVDGSAAQRDLGVVPEYDLRRAVTEMIDFYRAGAADEAAQPVGA